MRQIPIGAHAYRKTAATFAACARRANYHAHQPIRIGLNCLARLRCRWPLSPQPLEIVELADFRPEHVHDHVAGVDQHPVAVGQTFDVKILVTGFLQRLHDVFRNRADVPVGPARGDDHVVGKCGFAAKVDGDRFFRLHIVEAGEDHIQRLVGVALRLQGRSFGRCFTRGFRLVSYLG